MPSFLVTPTSSNGTTQQTLGTGQNGFVATGATLYTETATAVLISGNAALTVMGTVASSSAAAVGTTSAVADIELFVGAQGAALSAEAAAISLSVSDELRLSNAGLITGQSGLLLTGSTSAIAKLSNSGTISALPSGSDTDRAINITAGFAEVSLVNSGLIETTSNLNAAIGAAAGTLRITNTGQILSQWTAIYTPVDLVLTNIGTITGSVTVVGDLFLTNAGRITGDVSVGAAAGALASVTNTGVIDGNLQLGMAGSTYNGVGGRVNGVILGRSGTDIYTVDGLHHRIRDDGGTDTLRTTVDMRIQHWAERLEAASDSGLALAGSRRGETIDGGAGDDTLTGAGGNDVLTGDSGDDSITAGNGDDTVLGSEGQDTISGGEGNDLISTGSDATGAGGEAYGGNGDDSFDWASDSGILLDGDAGRDTLVATDIIGRSYAIDLTAGTALGTVIATGATFTATLAEIENARGGQANDTITGSGEANLLSGRAGNDTILGGAGGDTLLGENGNDTLRGGEGGDLLEGGLNNDSLFGDQSSDTLAGGGGADTLAGGSGADRFVFADIADSTPAARDVITDFGANEILDLEALYGDPEAPVDVPFAFLGTDAFTGNGPEVRYFQTAGTTIVEIRFAESTADGMEIVLSGLVNLTAANFVL